MFRIELFVDDAKLPRVLHALVGLASGQPNVQPASNAQVSNGKIVAKVNGGDLLEILRNHLTEHKIAELKAKELLAFCNAHGMRGYGGLLARALSAKLLRRKANAKGVYLVAKGGK